ncbi:MAG: glycerol-3-phosphate 1-O-acyltransferase PlsY [Acidobacteriia bacterium]|nr:glycerol-3-phosphate 1-O-acyltransferase PlsY [Terriglobia bacterium]
MPLAGYLLGSIPFGLLLGKLFGGRDVRRVGSGNIGATNVARAAGAAAGLLTLLLDTAKGALPVWLAARFAGESATWMMIAGLAAIAGHCFPVWLGFRGGKGVATAAGVFFVLCPLAMSAAIALFILVVGFWGYVSLGSIAAAAAMPLLVYLFWAPPHAPPLSVSFGTLLAGLLIIWKHAGNIRRLLAGEEPRFALRRRKDGVDDEDR